MEKEQVELKVVEYAKSVGWDLISVESYILEELSISEFDLLDRIFSNDKARNIFRKYKPKRGRPTSDKTITPGLRVSKQKWDEISKKYKGRINKMFNDWIDTL